MEKLNKYLLFMIYFLSVASVSVALISSGYQRNLFYIAIYCSLLGLILNFRKVKFSFSSISFPIIILGLVKICWYLLFQQKHGDLNFYNDYLDGGKKLLLGGFLVFYAEQFIKELRTVQYKNIGLAILFCGFVSATAYGFFQAFNHINRVEMGINRPTIAAYVYSTFSVFIIFALYTLRSKIGYIIAGATIIVSYCLIILTGTRAAMICYLFMVACLTLYHFRKIHIKSLLIVSVLVAVCFAALYKPYIKPKIDQTLNEVSDYQEGNDNTSLGARFSMWAVGVHAFVEHPAGQSMGTRADTTIAYVKQYPHYQSSLHYLSIHLHNEFIDSLSLQGLMGGLSLLFFYVMLIYTGIRRQLPVLLFSAGFMILYGITDVLLISSEAIQFYIIIISLGLLFPRETPNPVQPVANSHLDIQ